MSLRLGIDVGSTTTKAVLLDANGAMLQSEVVATGPDGRAMARHLRDELLAAAGAAGAESGSLRVVATGYGRARVDFADRAVTEITCHARGVRFQHPDAAMVVDVGGQDSKVIRLDAAGRVEDFGMNDRCAAGTGSFLDVIARRFGLDVSELAALHALRPAPFEISSTCVVFAETEVVSLLAQGHPVNDVLAGVQRAVARRVVTLIKHVGLATPVYFSGGVAKNESVRREIEALLEVPFVAARHPQLSGALGAALLAGEGGASGGDAGAARWS